MRSALAGILLLSMGLNGYILVKRQATVHPPDPWIARDVERKGRTDVFENAPLVRAKTIFAGDSIVERCPWSEYLGRPVLNRGVDGDTTDGFIDRQEELRRHRPSLAIILIGVNDLAKGGTSEAVIANLEKVAKLKLASKCILLGLLNCAGTQQKLNASIAEVNEALRANAKSWGVLYVPPPADYDPVAMTYDGVHPNGKGYLAIAKNLGPYLLIQR